MRRVLGVLFLAAMLCLTVGCGPKESKQEKASQEAELQKQQDEQYKANQNPEPAKPNDASVAPASN